MKRIEKETYRWLPYKVLKVYVLATLFMSLFGPVKYGYDALYAIITVMYICTFLFITKIAMQKPSHYMTQTFVDRKKDWEVLCILKTSIVICVFIKVMLLVSSIRIYGIPEFDNVFVMLADVYSNMHHGEFVKNIFRQIDTFTTFLYYFSAFAGIFWFKRLRWMYRCMLLIEIALDTIYQVFFIGTQRAMITMVVLAIVILARMAIKKNLTIDIRKVMKIGMVLLLLFVLILNVLAARRSSWDADYYKNAEGFDYEHPLLFFIESPKMKYDICNVISYLTQGYYGLSLSFQVPFEWTCFLGGVRGLNSIVSQVFPGIPDMVQDTYPVRAGEIFEFNGLSCWYTIFPWLASDLSFIGALIYMGFAAKLYMKTWIQSIKYNNPFAFIIFILLTIQYIFLVANNQLFIQRGEAVAVVILLGVYLIYGDKCNYSNKVEIAEEGNIE